MSSTDMRSVAHAVHKHGAGFTLVELIIYFAVLALILIALVEIADIIQQTRTRFIIRDQVHTTAARVLNTVNALVRNSDGFVNDTSNNDCVFQNKLWLYFATSSVQYLPEGCMGLYTSGAVAVEPYRFSGATTTDNGNSSDGYIGQGFAIDGKYMYSALQMQTDWALSKRYLADMSYDTGFDGDGRIYTNLDSADAFDITLDEQFLFVYGGGSQNVTGRIEKRRVSDGALCTAANCGTAFDTDGVLVPARSTRYYAAEADSTYLYLGGFEDCYNWRALCQSQEQHTTWWQIAKINKSTGAYDTGFDSDGHLEVTSGEVRDIAIDTTNNWLYAVGYQGNNAKTIEKRLLTTGAYVTAFDQDGKLQGLTNSGNYTDIEIDGTYMYLAGHNGADAVVEKRLLSDGSLVSAFGTNGVATSQSSTLYHWGIAVDGDYLYLVGSNSGPDWYYEKRSRTTGQLVSSFGTDGFLLSTDTNTGEPYGGIALDENYIYAFGYYAADFGPANGRGYTERRSRTSGALVSSNGIRLMCYQDYPNNGTAASCLSDPPHDDVYRENLTDPIRLFVGLTDLTFATTTIGSKQAIETRLNINHISAGTSFGISTVTVSTTEKFRVNP